MTREEEAIRELKIQFVGEYDRQREAKDIAIETMHKYQKIQKIVEHWACCGNPSDAMIAISEVLEDGDDTCKGDAKE